MERLFIIAIIALPIIAFAKVNNFEQAAEARELKLPPIRSLKPVKVTKLAKHDFHEPLGIIRLTKISSRF